MAHPADPSAHSWSLLLVLVLAFINISLSSWVEARESTLDDKPAPDSVEKLEGPLESAFEMEERDRRPLWNKAQKYLKEKPAFIRDTEIEINLRSFYFNRRRTDGTQTAAWAGGGSLNYQSGTWADIFSIGAELYTSQPVLVEEDEDGTLLLEQDQEGYTVLGRAYATFRFYDQEINLFRRYLDLPYVNRRDNRMTPITFEAYDIKGRFGNVRPLKQLDYIAGYVARMKPRNEDQFFSMAESAGVRGDEGLWMGGVRLTLWDGFSLGAIDYHVPNVLNISYGAADYTQVINDSLKLRFQGQFSHQQSTGADRLTGRSFHTWVAGLKAALSYRNAMVWSSFTSTDDEEKIRSPFGSYPGYISLMQKDFNRAGEDAWSLGLSYDFKGLGAPGLSAFALYAEGMDARNPLTGISLPRQREGNLTIDYRPDSGRWQGFWVRVRGSILEVDNAEKNSNELRVILNYEW